MPDISHFETLEDYYAAVDAYFSRRYALGGTDCE